MNIYDVKNSVVLKYLFVFLSINLNSLNAIQAQIIVIDAGHGYNTDGSPGDYRTTTEINTNYAVSLKLRDLIQNNCNWSVVLTRPSNGNGSQVGINARCAMANDWNADRLLSIHCNATDPPGLGNGTETFWSVLFNGQASDYSIDEVMAREVQARMVQYGEWHDRYVGVDYPYLPIHLGILNYTIAPACLNEIGFVDVPINATKLLDNSWRDKFANAYYIALQNHLGNPCSGVTSAPDNDNCSKAKILTLGTTYSGETLAGATKSSPSNDCGTTKTTQITDVWYKFKATSTTHTITATPSSGLDIVIDLRSGSCDGQKIDCKDEGGGKGKAETLTYSNFKVDDFYFVRIYQDGSKTTDGFSIHVSGTSNATATLTGFSFPSTVDAGSTFNIYNCTIQASANMNVLLGASLYRNGIYYSDPSNDKSIQLSSIQTNVSTRKFNLSSTVPSPPAGIYDIIVALWRDNNGNGKIDDGDTQLSSKTNFQAVAIMNVSNYTISTSSNPSAGGTTSGNGTYQSGQSRTVTASANNGYTFSNWTENGSTVSTNTSYTFTLSGNRTLVANFTQNAVNYTISTSSNPSAGGTTSGNGTYQSGQSRTVTASANNGYTFSNWTENGSTVSTNTSYTFTLSGNRTLVANFTQNAVNYTISTSSNPSAGGTTSGNGTYQSGQSRTVTASANNGYTFSNWTENGSTVSTNTSYTFTLSGNRTLVANFTQNAVNYTISTSSNPSAGGTTSGNGTYQSGQSRTVTASANNGYTFSNWTENGSTVSTNTSYTFTLSGNRTLVANFTQNAVNYTISTSSNPSAGGTTSGNGTYQSGQSRTVTASANNGYTFSNWTENGSTVSTNTSYTFTLSGNRTLVANFTQNAVNYTISTSSNPSAGGTTSGNGTYQSGQSRTVTASANNGYTFSNWTENGSTVSTNTSYTFTLSGNRTLVANFTQNAVNYTISTSSNPSAGGTTSGNGTYQSGQSRTVTASANNGYTFSNWTENGSTVSTNTSYTFTLSGNRTIVANFATSSSCIAPDNVVTLPSNPTVTAPNNISLNVTANGTNPFTYQWYWWDNASWTPLTNSLPYSGTTTNTLSINPTSTSMDGYLYTCLVTNSCGSSFGTYSIQLKVNASKPAVIVSTTSLPDFGSVAINTTSSAQSFTVSGSNLTANISLSAPAGFEISKSSGSGYGTLLSLTQTGGTVSSTTIYVRFSPTSVGAKSGEISVSSTGSTTKKVAVSGRGTTVIEPSITVSANSLSDFGSVVINTTSTAQTFTVSGSNLTANISLSAPAGFEISKSSGSGYGTSLSLTQTGGTVSSTTIYVRFRPTSAGAKSGEISVSSTGATTKKVVVSGTGTTVIVSTITVSANSLLDFGSVAVNTTSTAQSFTVLGSNLTANISLSAPAGFEISKSSGSGYGTLLSLTQNGGNVSITTIYVRFRPTSAGATSGEISVSSTGATTKKVAVSGTGGSICTPPVLPVSLSASETIITVGEFTTLQVNGGALNDASDWIWSKVECGGTKVGSGATLLVKPTQTTTYYVQASACGVTTECKGITITVKDENVVVDVDGNEYSTVTIGSQIWLGQNLKTTKYNDGTQIPLVTDNKTWVSFTSPAYCWYKNDIGNKNPYGALYNWYSVNTGKLCPTGWHVPTKDEWSILINYVGGETVAGDKLKEKGNIHWYLNDSEELDAITNATDEFGFTALPGGERETFNNGSFFMLGAFGSWWSLSEINSNSIWSVEMSYWHSRAKLLDYYNKKYGLSVRCLCDLTVSNEIVSEVNTIKVYPNPTTGIITIEGLPENEKAEIALYNMNSKLVKVHTSYSSLTKMDISDVVSGVYLLVFNNHFEQAIRIIKK